MQCIKIEPGKEPVLIVRMGIDDFKGVRDGDIELVGRMYCPIGACEYV